MTSFPTSFCLSHRSFLVTREIDLNFANYKGKTASLLPSLDGEPLPGRRRAGRQLVRLPPGPLPVSTASLGARYGTAHAAPRGPQPDRPVLGDLPGARPGRRRRRARHGARAGVRAVHPRARRRTRKGRDPARLPRVPDRRGAGDCHRGQTACHPALCPRRRRTRRGECVSGDLCVVYAT